MASNETRILNSLKDIQKRTHCYIHPVTLENLNSFLDGFRVACLVLNDELDQADRSQATKQVLSARGWKAHSSELAEEMQRKDMSEESIIKELLEIEIETWRRLLKQPLNK